MWKAKPHSTGEVSENINIQKLFRSYEFLTSVARSRNSCNSHNMGKVNCHGIGKMDKTQTFQNYGFLKCFAWGRNPYNPKSWEKWNTLGKVQEDTNIPKLWVSLTFPKIWENLILIVREERGKTKTFQS